MYGFKQTLNAYLGEECIGTLGLMNDSDLCFLYHENWRQKGYAISPYLPLDNSASENQLAIKAFFQNLFPEEVNLDILLNSYHLARSNIFAITQTLGLDLSGAMQMVLPSQELPMKALFRPIKESEIIERLGHDNKRDLVVWDGKLRLSLAGVHQKINVVINKEDEMGFGDGALSSTHILKFERVPKQHLVLNEFIMMKLARDVGLSVADVALKKFGPYDTLLVKRFDREWGDKKILRRHVIDGCQALNLLPSYKYERQHGSGRDVKHIRDGASLPALFAFCETCRDPIIAKMQLLNWVLFNVIIGNWDAHGKNISFFISPLGIEVAPAYDLISVRVYPEFSPEWAMALGDEFDARSTGAYQLADFADSCGLSRMLVAKALVNMCDRIAAMLPRMSHNQFTDMLRESIRVEIESLKKQAKLIARVTL